MDKYEKILAEERRNILKKEAELTGLNYNKEYHKLYWKKKKDILSKKQKLKILKKGEKP